MTFEMVMQRVIRSTVQAVVTTPLVAHSMSGTITAFNLPQRAKFNLALSNAAFQLSGSLYAQTQMPVPRQYKEIQVQPHN